MNNEKQQLFVWHEGDTEPTTVISNKNYLSSSFFVTSNGDIYIDDGEKNGRVEKWTRSTNEYSSVLFPYSSCKSLFVDRNDNLYCSMTNRHHVVKVILNDPVMTTGIVAGTTTAGSVANRLNSPRGIFVDRNLDLYVADCGNHRVQRFRSGTLFGDTVVGSTSAQHKISLSCPTGVTLDAQNFLFTVDSNNHRILRSNPNGVHCVVGCDGISLKSTELSSPSAISFDRSGNMFVVDTGNDLIQKFQYSPNSCGKFHGK